jgi:chitodextrinase
MSATRPHRLGLLTALLGLALVLPSAVAAGAGWKTLEGRLVAAHSDGFGGAASPRSVWYDTLVTASGEVALSFKGKRPEGFYNGAKVRVRGAMSGRTLMVGSGKGDASVQAPAVAAITGEKRLAVLLIKFDAAAAEPYTAAQAQGVIFSNNNSVANYFAEESYGLMTVTGDVFGYYTISINTSTCDYTDIGNKARAAATAAGVNLSAYSQIQYVHTYLGSCGWSGLAYVPGRDSWLNQALNLRVSAHELSHNYGVHHASTMSCSEGGVRVTLSATSSNCSSNEYGDPFSILGSSSTRHTHNQQLASMGWITGGNLQTITTSGTYTIGAAADANATSPRGVRIARGNGTWFYLELRQPFGSQFDNFNASDPAVNGVSIRISYDWTTIVQSQLLDTTPATSTYGDAPLAVGASFFDPLSGVSVTTVSVAGGVATVNVSWGADSIAPSAPGNPQVVATGASTARFTWTASTDNVGVAGYRVSRDGVVLGTVTGTQYNDTGLVPLTAYLYSVVALDAAGNASGAASRSFTMPQPDTTAPTAPTNLRATSLTKSKANLAWNASSDAVGVAGYRVYRNGVLVATVTGLTWSESRQRLQTTYYVRAFDAAGNVSAQSNTLTVPKK